MNLKRSLLHKVTARYRKNKMYATVLRLSGNSLKEKKWIFILGCYNSGTTLLNQILADHPAISGLPDEGVMLTNQLVRPEDFGWQRMWFKCEQEMGNSEISKGMSAATIKKHWSHFYDNKEFLVEKSISNVVRIPFLEKEFQPAYFIHIVRNGYAVSEGIRRKARILDNNPLAGQKHYPLEYCINQWVRTLDVIENQKTKLNHFTEISYESLTQEPSKVIENITDFLGLEPFPPSYFNGSFAVHEKESPIRNMNSSSFKRLSPEEIETINSIAGTHLLKYGYKLK